MKRIIAGLVLASAAVPAEAIEAVAMRFECRESVATPGRPSQLAGLWDVLMDVGGVPSFGLLSVATSGAELAGSLALNAGVVVVRSLVSDGASVTLVVASGEGDVRFEGALAPDGKRMCGIVSYHGGQKFEMVAQKRPDRAGGRGE